MPTIIARAWILTISNPKIPCDAYLNQWFADGDIVFGCGQYEKGEKGLLHHQIYIVTKKNDNNKEWLHPQVDEGEHSLYCALREAQWYARKQLKGDQAKFVYLQHEVQKMDYLYLENIRLEKEPGLKFVEKQKLLAKEVTNSLEANTNLINAIRSEHWDQDLKPFFVESDPNACKTWYADLH